MADKHYPEEIFGMKIEKQTPINCSRNQKSSVFYNQIAISLLKNTLHVRKYPPKRTPYEHARRIDGGLFLEFPSANLSRSKFISHSLWKNYRSSTQEVSRLTELVRQKVDLEKSQNPTTFFSSPPSGPYRPTNAQWPGNRLPSSPP